MNQKLQNTPFACTLISSQTVNARGDDMKFELQPLPYTQDALSPYISEITMQFHYGKHLSHYIGNTNKLKENTEFQNKTLEEIIRNSSGALFNNAAQVFNHYFQFEALQPHRAGEDQPEEKMGKTLRENFGSFENFKETFTQAALSLFGSGYVWLIADEKGHLRVIQTINGDNPLKNNALPLLNLDLWEHAYYLDVQNLRARYVENFWKIINWKIVEQRLACIK